MNGISKKSFLEAKDSKTRDGMLYDMIEGIYSLYQKQVSFKRTILIALLGGASAAVVVQSPSLMEALKRWIL